LEDKVDKGNGGESRERLTRDRICEAALEAIDEAGLESVSMRTLANALGVKASSLYYHFRCKDELLTGVAEYLYRKLGRPPSGEEWADQVKGTFVQLHDLIQVHPNAAPLLVRDLAYSPVAKKRAEALLAILYRAGLDPTSSASLISNLVALLVGHSLLSLYVQAETETAGGEDGGRGAGVYVPRAWVHQLSRVGDPEAPQLGGAVPGNGIPDEARPDGDRRVSQINEPLIRETSPGPTETMELPGDAVLLAGLDALIKGFTPEDYTLGTNLATAIATELLDEQLGLVARGSDA
jgi:AcrR family transcriptional regulator